MSQVITNRVRTSRRSAAQRNDGCRSEDCRWLASTDFDVQFGGNGLCGHAPGEVGEGSVAKEIETRFVLWFNGNGIPERYWIPSEEGTRLRNNAVSGAAGGVA
jgi:hypothetical protein